MFSKTFLKEKYGHLIKFIDNGRNQVSRIIGIPQLVLTLATFLTVSGYKITIENILLYSILGTIGMIIVGYFYSKSGLFNSEASSRFIETPQFNEILYNTRIIVEKIGGKQK